MDGGLDQADLLVEATDQTLAALDRHVDDLGLLGSDVSEFHDHISLVDVISVGAAR
jgi:hypothetical protein